MTWNRRIRLSDKPKIREQTLRTNGYRDGLNGRPAQSKDAAYQAGWRRGREARQAMQDGAA